MVYGHSVDVSVLLFQLNRRLNLPVVTLEYLVNLSCLNTGTFGLQIWRTHHGLRRVSPMGFSP